MSVLQVRIHVRYDHRTVKDHDKLLKLVCSQIESIIDKGLLTTDDGEVVEDFAVDAHYRGYLIPESPREVLRNLDEAIQELKNPDDWQVCDVVASADQARMLIESVREDITPLLEKRDGNG